MTKPATLAAAGSSENRTEQDLKTTIPRCHPDKKHLTALARRWRTLRLGCPMGCGSYHEEPCVLADREAVRR